MERWRSFFGSSGEDLWTVIDRAIVIAAMDYPQELRVRRDAFAEKLFAPALHFPTSNTAEGPRLGGRVENMFDPNICPLTSSIGERPALTRSDGGTGASPDSETADVREGQHKNHQAAIPNAVQNFNPLTEEASIKESEESRQIREIRILKEQIMNIDQGEEDCFLRLCKLESMNICVPALKATGIGKPVNGLRKHASRRIRVVAKRLVSSWKDVVDEWVSKEGDDYAVAFLDSGSLGVNGCKNGAVSPCQNDSKVPGNIAGSTKIQDISRADTFSTESWHVDSIDHRHVATNPYDAGLAHPQSSLQIHNPHMNSYLSDLKVCKGKWDHGYDCSDNEPNSGHRNHTSIESGIEGSKSALDYVGNCGNKIDTSRQALMDHNSPRPSDIVPEPNRSNCKAVTETKPKCKDPANELNRLEAAKRRLQENYRQADKVKKQRTLQVLDMDTIPKGTSLDSSQLKSNWAGSVPPGVHSKRTCPVNIRK